MLQKRGFGGRWSCSQARSVTLSGDTNNGAGSAGFSGLAGGTGRGAATGASGQVQVDQLGQWGWQVPGRQRRECDRFAAGPAQFAAVVVE